VNEKDEMIGTGQKLQVHEQGLLHRAFSVFIFDSKGRMLLQQRAREKYHGAYLWTNACCSHPYPNEDVEVAALRRLNEELGFHTQLKKIFEFTYHAKVENDLIEHEFDHVFAGEYEDVIRANPAEVMDFAYQSLPGIKEAIAATPEKFTSWFKIAFPKVEQWWIEKYG
jgi:isopentenyl-diphosphate delta-isomerase